MSKNGSRSKHELDRTPTPQPRCRPFVRNDAHTLNHCSIPHNDHTHLHPPPTRRILIPPSVPVSHSSINYYSWQDLVFFFIISGSIAWRAVVCHVCIALEACACKSKSVNRKKKPMQLCSPNRFTVALHLLFTEEVSCAVAGHAPKVSIRHRRVTWRVGAVDRGKPAIARPPPRFAEDQWTHSAMPSPSRLGSWAAWAA